MFPLISSPYSHFIFNFAVNNKITASVQEKKIEHFLGILGFLF